MIFKLVWCARYFKFIFFINCKSKIDVFKSRMFMSYFVIRRCDHFMVGWIPSALLIHWEINKYINAIILFVFFCVCASSNFNREHRTEFSFFWSIITAHFFARANLFMKKMTIICSKMKINERNTKLYGAKSNCNIKK